MFFDGSFLLRDIDRETLLWGWERLEGYGCGYDEVPVWTPETCSYEVIVHADGKVSSNLTSRTRQNKFYVPWKNGYPQAPCPAGCRSFGDGCSCPMQVETRRVFSSLPSAAQVSSLRVGAVKPKMACSSNCQGTVKVYGNLDEETVFEHQGRFYKNKEVVVLVGSFEFRNPPSFVTLDDPQERDIHSEVESLLDHLTFHENTAPFISYRLIQRFTTSNPSPSYVAAVAEAFRSGSYGGKTYGGVPWLKEGLIGHKLEEKGWGQRHHVISVNNWIFFKSLSNHPPIRMLLEGPSFKTSLKAFPNNRYRYHWHFLQNQPKKNHHHEIRTDASTW